MLIFMVPAALATVLPETNELADFPLGVEGEEPAPAPGPPPPPPQGGGAHLRFGLGADLAVVGASFPMPNPFGFGVGLQARLGVQLSPWFAIYYQPHAIGAIVVNSTTNGGVLGGVFNSVNFEFDLPVLQLGVGPSFDVFGVAGCNVGTVSCDTGSGTYIGADARAALLLGPHGPGAHSGLAIEANLHPTFVDDTVWTTVTLGLAGEMY